MITDTAAIVIRPQRSSERATSRSLASLISPPNRGAGIRRGRSPPKPRSAGRPSDLQGRTRPLAFRAGRDPPGPGLARHHPEALATPSGADRWTVIVQVRGGQAREIHLARGHLL